MDKKIIIAGGRNFNDYDFLENSVLNFISKFDKTDIEIVSGGAKGVDALGERFAKEQNIEFVIFPADWAKYGRSAGPKRNAQMAKYATHLLSFWDGKSKGTKSMINLARKNDLVVEIISID
ncbi:DUF2493 domain-containing protein [Maribacter sp. Asnod2-G09]|uniref:DUF2493 domain-containing protein n=1 Tax=Maribacter sp. Asnod2-G09 TaxID=3160577 RepID=UPI003867C35D